MFSAKHHLDRLHSRRMTSAVPANPRLRLITGNPKPRWEPQPVIADLTAHPFRPGETPTLVTLRLEAQARDTAEREATAARLPSALWLRIAVEATHRVREAAHVLG